MQNWVASVTVQRRCRLILLDVSAAASLHPALLKDEASSKSSKVVAILKPLLLQPLGLNEGPLVEHTSTWQPCQVRWFQVPLEHYIRDRTWQLASRIAPLALQPMGVNEV